MSLKEEYLAEEGAYKQQSASNLLQTNVDLYNTAINQQTGLAQAALGAPYGHALQNVSARSIMVGAQNVAAQRAQIPRPPSVDPNKQAAMQMSLSALRDLWAAKYGDTWKQLNSEYPPPTNTEDAQFWSWAEKRLRAAEMCESVDGWIRLKEDNGNR